MISRPNRKGYVLIVTCLALLVIAGIAAMAIDAGRMYIARSEVQAFADSAALAASLQLNGTPAGLARAKAAVQSVASGENAIRWDMGTKTVADTALSFAQAQSGPPRAPDPETWSSNPADAGPYCFARVAARVEVPLTFLRVFLKYREGSSANAWAVSAIATAGRLPRAGEAAVVARLVE